MCRHAFRTMGDGGEEGEWDPRRGEDPRNRASVRPPAHRSRGGLVSSGSACRPDPGANAGGRPSAADRPGEAGELLGFGGPGIFERSDLHAPAEPEGPLVVEPARIETDPRHRHAVLELSARGGRRVALDRVRHAPNIPRKGDASMPEHFAKMDASMPEHFARTDARISEHRTKMDACIPFCLLYGRHVRAKVQRGRGPTLRRRPRGASRARSAGLGRTTRAEQNRGSADEDAGSPLAGPGRAPRLRRAGATAGVSSPRSRARIDGALVGAWARAFVAASPLAAAFAAAFGPARASALAWSPAFARPPASCPMT